MDHSVDHTLQNLRAYCRFNKYGCKAMVPLKNLLEHEDICFFSNIGRMDMQEWVTFKDRMDLLENKITEIANKLEQLLSRPEKQDSTSNETTTEIFSGKVREILAHQHLRLEKKVMSTVNEVVENKIRMLVDRSTRQPIPEGEKTFNQVNLKIENRISEKAVAIKNSLESTLKTQLKYEVRVLKNDQRTKFHHLTQSMDEYCEKVTNEIKSQFEICIKDERNGALRHGNNDVTGLIISIVKHDLFEMISEKIEEHKILLKKELEEGFRDQRDFLLNDLQTKVDFLQLKERINEVNEQVADIQHNLLSTIQNNVDEIKGTVNHLKPRAVNLIWEIEVCENVPPPKEYKSEIYQLFTYGCSLRFTFNVPWNIFNVENLNEDEGIFKDLDRWYRVTFICVDQYEHFAKHDYIRRYEPFFNHPWWWTINPFSSRNKRPFSERWIKNGKIKVNIVVEPLNEVVAFEQRHIGSLIWKIEHYNMTLQRYLLSSDWPLSEALYSSYKGYRMKLCLLHSQNCVHVLLIFLKGPWDDTLPKEFKFDITFKFINQDDDQESKVKTFYGYSGPGNHSDVWFSDVMKAGDVEKLVKHGTLMVKVTFQLLP